MWLSHVTANGLTLSMRLSGGARSNREATRSDGNVHSGDAVQYYFKQEARRGLRACGADLHLSL